jgi:N-acetylmuramoyl-L-alanine amidase
MSKSIDTINQALAAKAKTSEQSLNEIQKKIKKAQDVKTAKNVTALGIKVGTSLKGIQSLDQMTTTGGKSTAGQLVKVTNQSDFVPSFDLVSVEHTGRMNAPDSDGSGNYDPVDSDGTANTSQPEPASKDSKAGNVLSTDITGFAPPVESIEIVALGGAAVDQLTTAIGTSTDRKVELIESIASTASETTKQPGGIPSSFTKQVNAIKLKIQNPFADANTLDYFQKSLLYNSHAKRNGAFHAVHGYRLPASAGFTNSIMLHILPADKLDKKVAGSMRVWSNMPGLQGWEGQYFRCWVSEFPNSEPITGLFGIPLVWLSQQPNPYAWSWTHDDEFFSRKGVGSDQQSTKIWGIPQDMGNLYINMAIIGKPFGPYTINDGTNAPFTITDYTHGWSNRIGHIEGYLPELIDTPDEAGIDSATTDLLTGITAVSEYASTGASALAETVGNATSIGTDTAIGAAVGALIGGTGNLAGGLGNLVDDLIGDVGDFVGGLLPDIDTGFGAAQDLFEDLTGSVGNLLNDILPNFGIAGDVVEGVIKDILEGGDANLAKAAKAILGADPNLSPEMREAIQEVDLDNVDNIADLSAQIDQKAIEKGVPAAEREAVSGTITQVESALDKVDTTISGSIAAEVGDFYTEDTDLAELVNRYIGAATESFTYVDSKEELGLEFSQITRKISEVIIHASDTYTNANIGSEEIHLRHNDAGHDGLQYHFVIRRDGRLQRGKPIDDFSDASKINGHEQNCIDVCLVGGINVPTEADAPSLNLSASSYTQAQMKTLEALLEAFYQKVPGGQVLGHNDIDPESPDPYFDVRSYVENLFGKKSIYENLLVDASVSLADLVKKKPV